MDFGRGVPLDGIDFTLPPDPAGTQRTLAGRRPLAPRAYDLRVGSPRWADRGYVGTLYPEGTAPGDYLKAYSRALPTVELNATWYRCDAAQNRRWASQVPPGFDFCPKLPGRIGHEKRLRNVEGDVAEFLHAVDAFGDSLGVCWLLLPNDFGPLELPALRDLLERWPKSHRLAVELRHAQWFADRGARSEVFDLLRSTGTIAAMTDVAGRRDVLHMELTAPITFVRLALNDLDPSDFERVEAWADRLADWFERGLERAYLFVHQPDEPNNAELARHALRTFNLRTHAGLPVPRAQCAVQGRLF